jgi:hypothetical protein
VLPGLAAQRLRDQLAPHGQVLKVEVSAFPAIELLWHQADSVTVRLGRYRSTPAKLASLLGQASGAGTLDASATQLDTGLLRLHDATLRKRGDQLSARATVSESDLRSAFPILESVQPVASPAGQLILRGTASLLGVSVTAQAVVAAQAGQIVVVPDVPFGALATITLFSDPHVRVQSVAAAPVAGGFTVSAMGRLR